MKIRYAVTLLLWVMFVPAFITGAVAGPNDEPAAPAITTNLATYPSNQVPRYARFEATLLLNAAYSNPFDPQVVSIEGHFISPGGQELVQPGFFYQDYQLSRLNGAESYHPVGEPTWKVRFTPREPGVYRYFIRVRDQNGVVDTGVETFEVISSANPGFIRISPRNKRYFEFENRRPFLGFGLNVAWWYSEGSRLATYEYFFNRMQEHGANLARVWMTNSGRNQDWILSIQDQTLGNDYNLEEAWAFDRILELAEQKGVYLLLTLDDVNQFTYNWSNNLYNSSLGGPCAYRSELFTDLEARQYQQRVLRYIIARWGYSPNILSWELFNEIDELQWSDTEHWDRGAMIDWHAQMARYIQTVDAHRHLVNTSTGSFKTHPDLYGLPEMGLAEMHFYYVANCCDYAPSDPAGRDMADLTRYYAHLVYNSVTDKPSLIGEWGLLDEYWNPSPFLQADDQGVHLHNGLWSSLMSGMAATGLHWSWQYHQLHDTAWWRHYRALRNFFEGVYLPDLTVMKPLNVTFSFPNGADNRPPAFASTNNALRLMGLRSGDRVYAWVQNTGNTWWNYTHGIPPIPQSGLITVYGFRAGKRYSVEWWDTYATASQILARQEVTALGDGSIQLTVNQLETDRAFKVSLLLPERNRVPLILK